MSAQTFHGPEQVARFQIVVIAQALELYDRHKMRVNRAYTPTAMLKAATRITGQTFKRGQYAQAAQALRGMLQGPQA